MRVEIHSCNGEADQKIGVIHWDGQKYDIRPQDSKLLANILNKAISVRGRQLTSKDGEEFLRALSRQYKSAYLRAELIEDEQDGQAAHAG